MTVLTVLLFLIIFLSFLAKTIPSFPNPTKATSSPELDIAHANIPTVTPSIHKIKQSGLINGIFCSLGVVVNETCFSELHEEGMICSRYDGHDAYCSYDLGLNVCAYCEDLIQCFDDNDCAQQQWCSSDGAGGRSCKDYVGLSESCEQYGAAENYDLCDPSVHYCYRPAHCVVMDTGGFCVALSELLRLGDCCENHNQCESKFCDRMIDEYDLEYKMCQVKPPTNANPNITPEPSSATVFETSQVPPTTDDVVAPCSSLFDRLKGLL